MSIEKVLDDYKLVIVEGIPVKTVKEGKICKPKEITRDELLNAVGNETFGEVIKWEDKKQYNVKMQIESTNKKTNETRYFQIYWTRMLAFFDDSREG